LKITGKFEKNKKEKPEPDKNLKIPVIFKFSGYSKFLAILRFYKNSYQPLQFSIVFLCCPWMVKFSVDPKGEKNSKNFTIQGQHTFQLQIRQKKN
jgi:hypothetical protein